MYCVLVNKEDVDITTVSLDSVTCNVLIFPDITEDKVAICFDIRNDKESIWENKVKPVLLNRNLIEFKKVIAEKKSVKVNGVRESKPTEIDLCRWYDKASI